MAPIPNTHTTFKEVTRKSISPVYEQSPPKKPLPPQLELENLEIDTTPFNKEEVINSGPVPEVIPKLAGIRHYIAEKRAERLESKAEKLVHEQLASQHAAVSIIRGDPHFQPFDEKRPMTATERRTSKKLNRLDEKRRLAVAGASTLVKHVYDKDTGERAGQAFIHSPPKEMELSLDERRNNGTTKRMYKRHMRAAQRYDEKIEDIVINPKRADRAEKARDKRDDLFLKTEALRRQKEANKQVRQEFAENTANKVQEAWSSTKSAARTGAEKATSAYNTAEAKAVEATVAASKFAKEKAVYSQKAAKHIGEFTLSRMQVEGWAELADQVVDWQAEIEAERKKK
ncbi:MAG TPA: hypothetical protein VK534_02640 [Methylomirabilota bacterium]|nr:hypothetical protein [Methylomirabilota bacterium]